MEPEEAERQSGDEPGATAVLDLLPTAVFVQDGKMRLRWLNRAAEKMFGIRRRDVVGRYCYEVLRCSMCSELCATCRVRKECHAQYGVAVELRDARGTSRSLLMDAFPLHEDLVAAVLCDVTNMDCALRSAADLERCRRLCQELVPPSFAC